jgi:DNA modification methylase
LYHGDNRDVLRQLPDNSLDSCVTDPPYALVSIVKRFGGANAAPAKGNDAYMRASAGFMGKTWDTGETAFSEEFWVDVLRVLKPGGHVAAFGASRGYHRMACAIEDAGFEIRDSLMWVYGTGFPKSHDVSKGIDKARDDRPDILRVTTFVADAADRAGKSRSDIDTHMGTSDMGGWWTSRLLHRCQCPKWEQWLQLKAFLSLGDEMDSDVWRLNERKGEWGEAAKQRGTIETTGGLHGGSGNTVGSFTGRQLAPTPVLDAARQWEGWGTALKPAFEPIVLARKPLSEGTVAANVLRWRTGALNIDGCRVGTSAADVAEMEGRSGKSTPNKIYGANINGGVVTEGTWKPSGAGRWPANVIHDGSDEVVGAFPNTHGAGKARTAAEGTHSGPESSMFGIGGAAMRYGDAGGSAARFFYSAKASKADRAGSKHPTVKPVALMSWLARLITPPGGTVLDPFAGSGTTGEAAEREGFRAVLIEREAEYVEDIKRRLTAPSLPVATAQAAQPANDNTPQADLFAA